MKFRTRFDRRALVAALVCVGAVATALFVMRSRNIDTDPRAVRNRVAEVSQARYGKLVSAWSDLTDQTATDDAVMRAEVFGSRDAHISNLLLLEVREFVRRRISPAASAASYADWRASEGFSFRSREELLNEDGVADAYKYFLSKDLPEQLDVPAIFDAIWQAELASGNGANRAVKLASGAPGVSVSMGTISKGNETPPDLRGQIGFEAWYGSVSRTARCWWRHPRDMKHLLDQYKNLTVASVGLILQYENGARRPVILTYVLDPQGDRWRLTNVNLNNFATTDPVSGLDY